jgi:hypothetical protein
MEVQTPSQHCYDRGNGKGVQCFDGELVFQHYGEETRKGDHRKDVLNLSAMLQVVEEGQAGGRDGADYAESVPNKHYDKMLKQWSRAQKKQYRTCRRDNANTYFKDFDVTWGEDLCQLKLKIRQANEQSRRERRDRDRRERVRELKRKQNGATATATTTATTNATAITTPHHPGAISAGNGTINRTNSTGTGTVISYSNVNNATATAETEYTDYTESYDFDYDFDLDRDDDDDDDDVVDLAKSLRGSMQDLLQTVNVRTSAVKFDHAPDGQDIHDEYYDDDDQDDDANAYVLLDDYFGEEDDEDEDDDDDEDEDEDKDNVDDNENENYYQQYLDDLMNMDDDDNDDDEYYDDDYNDTLNAFQAYSDHDEDYLEELRQDLDNDNEEQENSEQQDSEQDNEEYDKDNDHHEDWFEDLQDEFQKDNTKVKSGNSTQEEDDAGRRRNNRRRNMMRGGAAERRDDAPSRSLKPGGNSSGDDIKIYSKFLPGNHYYRYEGTLTTPPCMDRVHWRVMRIPLQISRMQLEVTNYMIAAHLNMNNADNDNGSYCELGSVGRPKDDGTCEVEVNRNLQNLSSKHKLTDCWKWNGSKWDDEPFVFDP